MNWYSVLRECLKGPLVSISHNLALIAGELKRIADILEEVEIIDGDE